MEATCFLRGKPLTTIPISLPSLPRQRFLLQRWRNNHNVRFSGFKNHSVDSEKSKLLDFSFRASGPIKASSSVTEANPTNLESKEEDVVFVAGAAGKVGSRTVRELLKLGFRVKAGVRNTQKAKTLVQSVKDMKLQNIDEKTQAVEKLEIVECDLEKPNSIQPALGNASVVICCIGASEKEVFDITGPYRIDYLATKNLVDAATSAKVNQFILVTSLGTNKFGFPAAVLNLFWGVLCWKRKAEEALIASGLNYAIVRPGGMERPTDAYKETHNLTLSLEDTLFGGQVSNLQVAELLACMAKNPQISSSKIVEVVAETTSRLTPTEELLQKIPYKRPYVPPPKKPVAVVDDKPVPTKPVTQEPVAPLVEEVPVAAKANEAVTQEPVAPMVEEEQEPVAAKEKEVQPRPLSPYASYEDLKPPTSPTPTYTTLVPVTKPKEVDSIEVSVEANVDISEVAVEEEVKQVEEKKERPLSPYASYDNLKPPSSPSPKASSTRKIDSSPTPVVSDTDKISAAATSVTETASAAATNVTETASVAATSATEMASVAATSVTETASAVATSVTETASAVATSVTETASAAATSVTETTSAVATGVTETAPAIPRMRPLSPFAAYDNLKPPSSPSPKASSTKKIESSPSPVVSDTDKSSAAATSVTETPSSAATSVTETASAVATGVTETSSAVATSVTETAPAVATSVTETASAVATSVAETASAAAASVTETAPAIPRMRPLSPFAAYPDLKPPTSPTPSSTGPKETASVDSASTEQNSELPGGNDVLKTADDSVDTIPSSVPEVTPANNAPETLLTSEDNTAQPSTPKPRPLSPYTMYEDMKPPTSPLPSPVINH